MSYTNNRNLPEMPVGAVEWVAIFNALIAKLEEGGTLKATAGETLAQYEGFYIDTDGLAYIAGGSNIPHGIWYSTSTAMSAEGYGQLDGIMVNGSWTWNEKALLYIDSSGALTETPQAGQRPVAWAFSPTEISLLNIPALETPISATHQTTSSSAAEVLQAITLQEGKAYSIEAYVTARQGDIHRASYIRRALVYRPVSGNAILQGSVQDALTNESLNEASSEAYFWDCTITVSGNDVRVMVDADVGTVDWKGKITIVEA